MHSQYLGDGTSQATSSRRKKQGKTIAAGKEDIKDSSPF
jgi:hypothetical protein